MKSDATTPKQFIQSLPEDWRRATLLEVRTLVFKAAPEFDERMHYGMLGYALDERYVFHLNAQRAYVSLYVGDTSKVDPDGSLLKGLNHGKGCIRLTKTKAVHKTHLGDFIGQAVKRFRAGVDIDC